MNLQQYGDDVLLGAVTAPGSDVLPWDESVCAGLGPHRHSGKLGCKVVPAAADEFNRSSAERWRRLHRRAYQEALRLAGPRSVRLLVRVWELQKRGTLHVHPVVGYGTAREKAGARAYIARLAELAPQYGFGFVERKIQPQAATRAAAYLSSYFVTGKRGKMAMWDSVTSSAMPVSIVHVSVELTTASRCTMRVLRLRRALFVIWNAELPFREVHAVRAILDAFGGSAELIREATVERGPPHASATCF